MKMQGVMSKDCRIDVNKHFKKPDYVAEKMAEETEKQRMADEREAKTTVGAVKRLIEKVGSLTITDNFAKPKDKRHVKKMQSMMPKKRRRSSSPDSPLSMKPKIARAKTFSRNSFLEQLRQPEEDKDDARTQENDE